MGRGSFQFERVLGWAQMPEGCDVVEVCGVAVDSEDRVYVFNRGSRPMMVFDGDGRFVESWGEGVFKRPHNVVIGPDDSVYCVEDWGHALYKFAPDRRRVLTIDTSERPADTGFVPGDYASLKRGGPPFNLPTDVALAPGGEMYVTDGYGNARVHKFTPGGELLFSWGEPGQGPGEFFLPHGVCLDPDGNLLVADRENSRIQIFTQDGEFITEWTDVRRPNQMCFDPEGNLYVAELGYLITLKDPHPDRARPRARVTVRDRQGRILTEWGDDDPYWAPHGIALDSRGDLYVGAVSVTYSRGTGTLPAERRVFTKYRRC